MAGGLLLLHAAMALDAARRHSPTFDEMAHLTAGAAYWAANDYRLNPENGQLPQRWAAAPLLAAGLQLPPRDDPAWRDADLGELGYRYFYGQGHDLGRLLLLGRGMIVLLSLGLGLLVYAWARSLWGPPGAALSLLLYAFSPTMLAHSGLATSDLALALTLLAAVGAWWRLMGRVNSGRLLASLAAFAALCLAKASALLALPMLAAVCLRRRPKTRTVLALAGLHGLVAVAAIWAACGLRPSAAAVATPEAAALRGRWAATVARAGPLVRAAWDHRLLPDAYVYGMAHVLVHVRQGHATFLRGVRYVRGRWDFHPYAFLIKTPLPLFGLLALAAAGWSRRRRGRRAGRLWPLAVLLVVYAAAAVATHLNLGHRHLLPLYPPLFILAGAAAPAAGRRLTRRGALALACAAWFVGESLAIRPHYLAYFNQLIGGPRQGWRHLVDSSLDWGQDLPGLASWLRAQGLEGEGAPVHLAYFGVGDPAYYGIRAQRLPGCLPRRAPQFAPLRGGVYVISATALQSVYAEAPGPWAALYERHYQALRAALAAFEAPPARRRLLREEGEAVWRERFQRYDHLRFARLCAWLRRRESDDHVGYSLLVYRLSDEQVREALEGPPAELVSAAAVQLLGWCRPEPPYAGTPWEPP